MKKAFKCLIALAVGFVLGYYFPYYYAPDDFGEYSFDGEYKYVITVDETRLCEMVSILNKENDVIFHTDGYMYKGWHSGKHDIEVAWANNNNDIFVYDSRSTLDVYLNNGSTFDGPYGFVYDAQNNVFYIYKHSEEYYLDAEERITYDEANIPEAMVDLIKH